MNLTTKETQYYPTPPELAKKMLHGIEWDGIENVLEPSAGTGSIVKCLVSERYENKSHYNNGKLNIDCIEIDPNLQQILKYNFTREAHQEAYERYRELDENYKNRASEEYRQLERMLNELKSANVRLIHDDFLTYAGYKRYQLCVMNPPFEDGDAHLLKALEVMRHGGTIVCLLNAETIRNPYSNRRKVLMRELEKREVEITYLEDAFTHAERKTDVEIALVHIRIPLAKDESDIYNRMEKAHEERSCRIGEITDMVTSDPVEQRIAMFRIEVDSGMELIRQYQNLVPYISYDGKYNKDCILTLTVGNEKNYRKVVDVNEYLRKTRLKYWRNLLNLPEFTGKLTSNLQEKWRGMIDGMADYDFTRFNINAVFREMNGEMADGLKDNIIGLFDKLTLDHSYYPECKNNRHYYDGWKTNKAHKIGKKVIIPTYGIFSDYSWSKKTFNEGTAHKVIGDIEKTLNYLDGGMTQEIDLSSVLRAAANGGQTRNVPCKYFWVDFYKKGTTHIKFRPECMDLVEKLNIYAARNRQWLPPNYGKVRYEEMDAEEQAVVDNFQGKEAYEHVMALAGYFLQGGVVAGLLGANQVD